MPDQPNPRPSRSQELFSAAPEEVKELIKKIMVKEREEEHKRNRPNIFQDLLTFIRESTP